MPGPNGFGRDGEGTEASGTGSAKSGGHLLLFVEINI